MEIKARHTTTLGTLVFGARQKLLFAFVVTLVAISAVSFLGGVIAHKTAFIGQTLKPALMGKTKTAVNMVRGVMSEPDILVLDVKHKHMQKIAKKRAQALKKGILIAGGDDYVPAVLHRGEKSMRVKIRLKGDEVDGHLLGDKWSFRVAVKDNETLFGMQRFSLHSPENRRYIHEWILHQAVKREGLIGLRYEFAELVLNGKNLGLYGIEEHFDKRLIENNRRREGPILSYSEDAHINNHAIMDHHEANKRFNYQSGQVRPYRAKRMLENPALFEQFKLARELLEGFRRETRQTCDVFDCDQLARYYAILDLLNGRHCTKYGNFKLYYNPVTSKIEPITYDAEFIGLDHDPLFAEDWKLDRFNPTHLVFSDSRFFPIYLHHMERMSDPVYLDGLFNEIEEELEAKLSVLYSGYPHVIFDREDYYKRQKKLSRFLKPPALVRPHFLQQVQDGDQNVLVLQIANILTIPLRINGLRVGGEKIQLLPEGGNLEVAPTMAHTPLSMEVFRFPVPPNINLKPGFEHELTVEVSIPGTRTKAKVAVVPWALTNPEVARHDLIRSESNLNEFPFLVVNETTKHVQVMPGVWPVSKDLIIPAGYRFDVGAGTTLDLSKSSLILSHSPVSLRGSGDAPITITSTDGSGQGLVVMQTTDPSVVDHVVFDRLTFPSRPGWKLTGGVTFYEAPVHIKNSIFRANQGEDALNIMRTDFTLEDSKFIDIKSDAFDGDFTSGRIERCSFTGIGNDAVDTSGSRITVRDLKVDGAQDKGLSAGEDSVMDAMRIKIMNTEIAVASKDDTVLTLKDAEILNSKVALTAYRKKPEYGAARIDAEDLTLKDVERPYLIEKDCLVTVDSVVVVADQLDVKEDFYGKKYGKQSER